MHQKPDLPELLLLKVFNNNEQYVGKYKNYSSFVCKIITILCYSLSKKNLKISILLIRKRVLFVRNPNVNARA